MNEPERHHAESKGPDSKSYKIFLLRCPGKGKTIGTEYRSVVTRVWWRVVGEYKGVQKNPALCI
jgi:hypothetical protein